MLEGTWLWFFGIGLLMISSLALLTQRCVRARRDQRVGFWKSKIIQHCSESPRQVTEQAEQTSVCIAAYEETLAEGAETLTAMDILLQAQAQSSYPCESVQANDRASPLFDSEQANDRVMCFLQQVVETKLAVHVEETEFKSILLNLRDYFCVVQKLSWANVWLQYHIRFHWSPKLLELFDVLDVDGTVTVCPDVPGQRSGTNLTKAAEIIDELSFSWKQLKTVALYNCESW